MKTATFVTTNDIKFNAAQHQLRAKGIELQRAQMDFQEIQAKDGEPIVRHKAEQAYAALQEPVIVTDDTWIIPGLNGFPGPYMKEVNGWFSSADFLRLTLPLKDRRIILRQHAIHQDAGGQHYFVEDVVGRLLSEIRGSSSSTILEVISFDDSLQSHAERMAAGQVSVAGDTPTVWHQVAAWLNQK